MQIAKKMIEKVLYFAHGRIYQFVALTYERCGPQIAFLQQLGQFCSSAQTEKFGHPERDSGKDDRCERERRDRCRSKQAERNQVPTAKLEALGFAVAANSFFSALVFNNVLRGPPRAPGYSFVISSFALRLSSLF